MNWKEFLKPEWRKIVIFVVIAAIVFIDTWIYETYETTTFGIGETSSCYVVDIFPVGSLTICSLSLNPMFWIFYNVEVNVEGGMIYPKLLIATYFIPLLYWYLLSCLIIWIYDKLRGK